MILPTQIHSDPQGEKPAAFCPTCGSELYAPGKTCLRCERRVAMTMLELSKSYEDAADPLRQRLKALRFMLKGVKDPEEEWQLKRRIAELTPLLTQMNELAELTAHYYDKGYYRNEKYTV